MLKPEQRDEILVLAEDLAGDGRSKERLALVRYLDSITAPEVSLVRAFNEGYMLGHHDTVESCFTDIHLVDMDTYHADIVAELIEYLAPQPGDSDER